MATTTPTTTFSLGEILKLSDIGTAATTAIFTSVYGGTPSARRSAEAVLISVLSRIMSTNFPSLTGGASTSSDTKNQIWVALVTGLVAAGMKRNVARSIVQAVSADLLSEKAFSMLGVPDRSLLSSA